MTDRIRITLDRISWGYLRDQCNRWLLDNQTTAIYARYKDFPVWLDEQVGTQDEATIEIRPETHDAIAQTLSGNNQYAWINRAVHPKAKEPESAAVSQAAADLRQRIAAGEEI